MKKENGMLIAGIVLLALQIIGTFGTIMGNSFPTSIPGIIGHFLLGIVGSILLIVGYCKKYNKDDGNNKDDKSENDKK